MLIPLALWVAIMTVVVFCNRADKPLTNREIDSLNRQTAYAMKRR